MNTYILSTRLFVIAFVVSVLSFIPSGVYAQFSFTRRNILVDYSAVGVVGPNKVVTGYTFYYELSTAAYGPCDVDFYLYAQYLDAEGYPHLMLLDSDQVREINVFGKFNPSLSSDPLPALPGQHFYTGNFVVEAVIFDDEPFEFVDLIRSEYEGTAAGPTEMYIYPDRVLGQGETGLYVDWHWSHMTSASLVSVLTWELQQWNGATWVDIDARIFGTANTEGRVQTISPVIPWKGGSFRYRWNWENDTGTHPSGWIPFSAPDPGV